MRLIIYQLILVLISASASASAVEIEDGVYRSSNPEYCDQKLTATYDAGVLTAIRLDHQCNGGPILANCHGNICDGQNYYVRITILGKKRYHWSDLSSTYPEFQADFFKF